jgi:hypothetical protein
MVSISGKGQLIILSIFFFPKAKIAWYASRLVIAITYLRITECNV